MRFIDSKTHAVLDYMSGVLFIVSPWVFGFANNDAAMWVPIIVGVMILVMSLMTNYEYSAIKAVPLSFHLGLDVVSGLFLIASPWLFDFAAAVMWPHVIFGMLEFCAGLFTEATPRTTAHETI